jgi:hypothetical protein
MILLLAPIPLARLIMQRVAIVRALAMKPELVLFNEVTSALDPKTVGGVLWVIRGCHDDEVAVMPGFLPVIDRTAKEAAEKLAELDQWTDLKSAMPPLEERIGHSLTAYDPDGPLPHLPISDQLRSRAELLTALARRENFDDTPAGASGRSRPRPSNHCCMRSAISTGVPRT